MIGFRMLFLVNLVYVEMSFGNFGCNCGSFLNTEKEANLCMKKMQDDILANAQHFLNLTGDETRIVGGYDVDSRCMKRPSLAYIKIGGRVESVGMGSCMGSIINRRFIVSAAHCFCEPNYGICQENNGKPIAGQTSASGHPMYTKGDKVSLVDKTVASRTTILIPGRSSSYNKDVVEQLLYNPDGSGMRKVASITIHPEYIKNKREQNDIAILEVTEDFDFSEPNFVSPICLADNNIQSDGIDSYVTGYGQIFEGSNQKAKCNTGAGGPSEFQPCRKFWVTNEDVHSYEDSCSFTTSPAKKDEDCAKLHEKFPDLTEVKSYLEIEGSNKTCYPHQYNGQAGWCATCIEGSDYGSPGYCKDGQTIDYVTDDEIDNRNDISPSAGWGYCDKLCYTKQTFSKRLQEATLRALTSQDCDVRTQKYMSDAKSLGKRPNPELEICAAKRQQKNVTSWKLVNGEYQEISKGIEEVWGGSDTCKGDSGGPMWKIENVGGNGPKAFLIGITNRGTGCAREDNYGIYARISYHLDWIKVIASSGTCASNYEGNDYEHTDTDSSSITFKASVNPDKSLNSSHLQSSLNPNSQIPSSTEQPSSLITPTDAFNNSQILEFTNPYSPIEPSANPDYDDTELSLVEEKVYFRKMPLGFQPPADNIQQNGANKSLFAKGMKSVQLNTSIPQAIKDTTGPNFAGFAGRDYAMSLDSTENAKESAKLLEKSFVPMSFNRNGDEEFGEDYSISSDDSMIEYPFVKTSTQEDYALSKDSIAIQKYKINASEILLDPILLINNFTDISEEEEVGEDYMSSDSTLIKTPFVPVLFNKTSRNKTSGKDA